MITYNLTNKQTSKQPTSPLPVQAYQRTSRGHTGSAGPPACAASQSPASPSQTAPLVWRSSHWLQWTSTGIGLSLRDNNTKSTSI